MPSQVNSTVRAGVYARYSSDNQSDASIDDQVRICRAEIERNGWGLVQVYTDAAVSGASTFRPEYRKLLQDASAGVLDVVVAESLDRVSRDLADVATLYKHLSFLSVRLWTVAEGQIGELHVGFKGTMNALYLKDLAQKTHRGQEGRVRSGMSGGGICYGYGLVPGQPGVWKINEAEAAVVVRIFEEYAAGRSPQAITTQLNKEQVPGPRGGPWRHTTIRGHITRGTGILNNELYIGHLVWNRQRFVKDPASGRRRSRPNNPARVIVEEVPELRIVSDELWNAVKTRQAALRDSEGVTKARATRFWERRRAQHLLSGLVHCGSCGSRLASVGRDYLACSAARGQGTCTNRKGRAPVAPRGADRAGIAAAPAGARDGRGVRRCVPRGDQPATPGGDRREGGQGTRAGRDHAQARQADRGADRGLPGARATAAPGRPGGAQGRPRA
jgi:site-specific DNA recombinase